MTVRDTVAEALADVIEPLRPPDPTTLDEARGYLVRGDPALLARADLGIDAGERLPAPGTARRRRYNATKRRYERYITAAGQQRGRTKPSPRVRAGLLDLARLRIDQAVNTLRTNNLAALGRVGFRLRVHAWIIVSPPKVNSKPQWIPGGRQRAFLHVDPEIGARVADAWRADDREAAARRAVVGLFISRQPDGRLYWEGMTVTMIDRIDQAEAEPA